jgi:two-component system, LytTR family, sensor kinase
MKKQAIYHFSGWLLYTGWSIWDVYIRSKSTMYFPSVLFTILELMMVFYCVSLYILPVFFKNKNYYFLITSISILYLFFLTTDYLIEGIYEPWDHGTKPIEITVTGYLMPLAWYYIQFATFGSAHYFAKQAILRERQLRIAAQEKYEQQLRIKEQEEEQLRLRSKAIELENAFLRAQLSPHFLFNILGLFQSKTRTTNPEVSAGIVTLSDMMRYMLKKPDTDGKVALEEETEQINNMIELYNLRFSKKVFVHFALSGSTSTARIVPNVIFTLAENALKHGELNDPQHPVTISIEVNNHYLHFTSHNKICIRPPEYGFSIGLANIKKRLDLTYNGKSRYEVNETKDFYTCNLSIPV